MIASGYVVIEDGHPLGHFRERAKLLVGGRDVDESDPVAGVLIRPDPVLVLSSHVAAGVAPSVPNGPRGTESIRTSRMVEAHSIHTRESTRIEADRLSPCVREARCPPL